MKKKKEDEEEDVEHKVHEMLKMSEISLILDTYDDIFSDFDPRAYFERALSVDFLEEAERASAGKSSHFFELNFLIPQAQRDLSKEAMIRKRLKEHFKKHFSHYEKEQRTIIRKGLGFTFLGVVLMFLAAFVFYKTRETSSLSAFLVVLFEPASWFLFWEGLNQAIFESKKIKPKVLFYKKMSQSHIHFFPY